MITISEILARLGERGRDLNHVKCPCHDDSNGSLVIKQMDTGKIAIKCMAGCEITDICEAIGITVHDLYNGTDGSTTPAPRAQKPKPEKKPDSKPEKPKAQILWSEGSVDYEYRSTDGGTRLMKRRWKKSDGGKSFTWDWWDGQRWQHGTNGTQAALYHADELPAAIAAGREIYLVEGEKDCDNWRALGFACTSAPHGAQKGNDPGGKWMAEHSEALSGADVIIIPDNDSTGKAFGIAVSLKLKKVCRRVRMIDLAESFPDLPEHGDISDALLHDG